MIGRVYTKNPQRFPRNVRFGDIVKGLPIPDSSAEAAYASHVLEHLTLEDFHKAVENTFRMLKPGGVFRTVVPDLERLAAGYLSALQTNDPTANHAFLSKSYLGHERRSNNLFGLIVDSLRTSQHHWMWDRCSLPDALRAHGFVGVRLCALGDNPDPMFALVEDPSRFADAVAVEAFR